jgi:hypothetical protein
MDSVQTLTVKLETDAPEVFKAMRLELASMLIEAAKDQPESVADVLTQIAAKFSATVAPESGQ